MKATVIVKVIGLISCLGGYVMASPAIVNDNALSLTERTACKSYPCDVVPTHVPCLADIWQDSLRRWN